MVSAQLAAGTVLRLKEQWLRLAVAWIQPAAGVQGFPTSQPGLIVVPPVALAGAEGPERQQLAGVCLACYQLVVVAEDLAVVSGSSARLGGREASDLVGRMLQVEVDP